MGAVIRFGSHVLDPGSGVLRRGIERRPLQSQPAELLALLIEHAGQVVTRDRIRERLWPDCVVEYDQNINFAIRHIRVALGPDAGMVQTLPRRGYRFVGDVTIADAAQTCSDLAPVTTVGSRVARTGLAVAAGMSLALTIGFGAGLVMRDSAPGQFVYEHLVHPDRCPYFRALLPTHRNS